MLGCGRDCFGGHSPLLFLTLAVPAVMHHLRALLALLLCSSWALAADAVKLRTLANKTIEGQMVHLTAKGAVIRTTSGETTVALPQILDIDFGVTSEPLSDQYTDVELTDGSLLHCSSFAIRGNQVELKLLAGQQLKMPLAIVSYILADANDAKNRDGWRAALAKRGNHDLVASRKGGIGNSFEVTFGDADAKGETITFAFPDGEKKQPKISALLAMSFLRQPNPDAPPALCRVSDSSHDVLAAARLTWGDTGLSVVTVCGVKIDYPRQVVARLDFSHGKLSYLSSMQPIKVVERSNVDRVEHYRINANLDGGPLQIAGYPKSDQGLAIHAYTELTYDLGGQYKELTAVLGVDSAVGGDSNVKVVITGDAKELFSATITRKDRPRPIKLPITDVRQLTITVSSAGPLDLGNHVDLYDAKVSK